MALPCRCIDPNVETLKDKAGKIIIPICKTCGRTVCKRATETSLRELLKLFQERLDHLNSLEKSEDTDSRIRELTSVIVVTQTEVLKKEL